MKIPAFSDMPFWMIISIIILIGVGVSIVIVAIQEGKMTVTNTTEECGNYVVPSTCIRCAIGCREYNFTFVKLNTGSMFTGSECWCKDGLKPIRIW